MTTIERLPSVSMDPDAHYVQPRFWEKTILGRQRRTQWQETGNRLVYSA